MNVLGTELYEDGFKSAVEECIQLAQEEPKNFLVSASDATVLVHSAHNPEFKKVLDDYYWNLPDGVPSVWLSKMKGAKNLTRCSGPDFFKEVVIKSKDLNINHFLLGGAPGVAEQLQSKCEEWGNKNFVGINCPPFRDLTEEEFVQIANEINSANTNILWVSLGAPKQLYFAHKIAKYTKVQFLITVGAAFDFHIGKVKKAPIWIQKIGMEWLYRVCMEPKRLYKRYLKTVPWFIFFGIKDYFKHLTNVK